MLHTRPARRPHNTPNEPGSVIFQSVSVKVSGNVTLSAVRKWYGSLQKGLEGCNHLR